MFRTNEAADNKQIIPAGISFPDFDQRKYIIPANVNEAPGLNRLFLVINYSFN